MDTFHERITWLDSKCKNKQELLTGYLRPILESKGMHVIFLKKGKKMLKKGKIFGNLCKNVQDFIVGTPPLLKVGINLFYNFHSSGGGWGGGGGGRFFLERGV